MNKFIKDSVQEMQISGIRRFNALASKYDDVIKLTIGELDFYTPENIKNATKLALDNNYTRYTQNKGIDDLRVAISNKYDNLYSKEEIVITVGTTEAISIIIKSIISPNDEIMIPTPGYVGYEPLVLLEGGSVSYVNTTASSFQITLESLEKAYSAKTKALLVTNPNNPTGYVLTEDEMDIIVDFVKAKDILLISDEIYEDTASKKDYKSFSKYTNLKKNLIILNGFSKSHAMTGFRIGYLLADLSLTKHFVKVHQYSVTSATTISQYAALEAIMTPFENLSNILKERRDYLLTRLEQMGITVNVSKGAFYLFPNISKFGMSSEEFCIKLLKENKLALIPGEYFLGNHTEYVRISYAAPIQVLEQAMNRLEAFLSNM